MLQHFAAKLKTKQDGYSVIFFPTKKKLLSSNENSFAFLKNKCKISL